LDSRYQIFPLGDSAVTIDLGNSISKVLNEKVLSIQQWMQENAFEGMKDCWIAYSSVTIVYDAAEVKRRYNPGTSVYEWVAAQLQEAFGKAVEMRGENGTLIRIPVCYEPEYGTDLFLLAEQKQLKPEAVIDMHISGIYRVYMIGFLPGFAYMGEVDERLAIPRKAQPVPVKAGSVGITGRQTGIYPLNSPGGWYIIGRTPVRLFDKDDEEPVKLKAGDQVQFYPISRKKFEKSFK
jgi:inhibitor of KinA